MTGSFQNPRNPVARVKVISSSKQPDDLHTTMVRLLIACLFYRMALLFKFQISQYRGPMQIAKIQRLIEGPIQL